jgi:hypothetical protein
MDRNEIGPPPKLQDILSSKDWPLCLDILKFAKLRYEVGFRFTELGNWLLDNNQELLTFYQDSDAKIPRSSRIANRRQRIQKNLQDLLKVGFLRIKSKVIAEKNNTVVPLYDTTIEGYLLACILFTDSLTYGNIIRLIESINKRNDSSILCFVIQFFRESEKKRNFARIVSHFVECVLPSIDTRDAKDILLSFLGHKRIVNWILFDKDSFCQAIEALDEVDKKLLFFEIKIEIESYYMENSLTSAWLIRKVNADAYIRNGLPQVESVSESFNEFSKTVGISSKQWQKVRLENANDPSKIIAPGSCSNCKSDKAMEVNVEDYLNSIPHAYGPYPSLFVSGICSECGGYASGDILRLEWFTSAWT